MRNWTDSAQVKDYWKAFVTMALDLWVSYAMKLVFFLINLMHFTCRIDSYLAGAICYDESGLEFEFRCLHIGNCNKVGIVIFFSKSSPFVNFIPTTFFMFEPPPFSFASYLSFYFHTILSWNSHSI